MLGVLGAWCLGFRVLRVLGAWGLGVLGVLGA